MATKTRTIDVAVALPPRALCGNGAAPSSKGGKIARSKTIRDQRNAAMWQARDWFWQTFGPHRWGNEDGPYFPSGRVRVDVLVKRDPLWAARRLDDQNLWIGLKATLDGLEDAGVVENDRQFTMGSVEWETADPLKGEIILTLTAEIPQQG